MASLSLIALHRLVEEVFPYRHWRWIEFFTKHLLQNQALRRTGGVAVGCAIKKQVWSKYLFVVLTIQMCSSKYPYIHLLAHQILQLRVVDESKLWKRVSPRIVHDHSKIFNKQFEFAFCKVANQV